MFGSAHYSFRFPKLLVSVSSKVPGMYSTYYNYYFWHSHSRYQDASHTSYSRRGPPHGAPIAARDPHMCGMYVLVRRG